MLGDSYFVGTFDRILEPLTNGFVDVFKRRFSQVMQAERDDSFVPMYRVKRDVAFSFEAEGMIVSGVIPKGFLCDGMSLGLPWPANAVFDRVFFKMWLVHDWLYNHRKANVNGISRNVSERMADKVFPYWMQMILQVASHFIIKTHRVRFSAHKLTPSKNLLISTPAAKILHQ